MNDWVSEAKAVQPSIPSFSDLVQADLSAAWQQGLSSAGYRLKHGENVWLSTPSCQVQDLEAVLRYCHQMRLEALRGQQRAAWFNSRNMLSRTDLLVFTQASYHYRNLKKDSDFSAHWVRANIRTGKLYESLRHGGRLLRTLVTKPSNHMMSAFDALSEQAFPFMVVIDYTPLGCREFLQEVVAHLEAYFPKCPFLIISHTGDRAAELAINEVLPTILHWRQHARDATPLSQGSTQTHELEMIVVPDYQLEDPLVQCLDEVRDLKIKLVNHPSSKNVVSILYRVINGLRNICVPLTFHETYNDKHRQGGLFQNKPLLDWLRDLQNINLPNGQAEQNLKRIVDQLNLLLEMLRKGSTGKEQALWRWLSEKGTGQSLVVVGSEREARMLRTWLQK